LTRAIVASMLAASVAAGVLARRTPVVPRESAAHRSTTNGHHWYAVYLQNVGRMDDALVERRRASELDPHSLLIALGTGDYFVYAREPSARWNRRNSCSGAIHLSRARGRCEGAPTFSCGSSIGP
jgi:hypothetical protein